MSEYLSTFQGFLNPASTLKLNLGDEIHVLLFSSIPDNWETMVVSISNSNPELTFAIVKEAVIDEELKRKE